MFLSHSTIQFFEESWATLVESAFRTAIFTCDKYVCSLLSIYVVVLVYTPFLRLFGTSWRSDLISVPNVEYGRSIYIICEEGWGDVVGQRPCASQCPQINICMYKDEVGDLVGQGHLILGCNGIDSALVHCCEQTKSRCRKLKLHPVGKDRDWEWPNWQTQQSSSLAL